MCPRPLQGLGLGLGKCFRAGGTVVVVMGNMFVKEMGDCFEQSVGTTHSPNDPPKRQGQMVF